LLPAQLRSASMTGLVRALNLDLAWLLEQLLPEGALRGSTPDWRSR
jgi:hypothetical protein